jgi:hypothetical protein
MIASFYYKIKIKIFMVFTINKKDKLINITFSYSLFEFYKKVIKKFSCITINTLLDFILIIFLWFYLLLFIFNIYVIYQILYNVFNAILIVNDNECETLIINFHCNHSKLSSNCLNRFIELFKPNSSVKYFTSYFVDINIRDNKYFISNFVFNDNNKLSTLEYIYSQQFNLSNSNRVQFLNSVKNLEMLYNICYEYSNDIKWIIDNNPLIKSM